MNENIPPSAPAPAPPAAPAAPIPAGATGSPAPKRRRWLLYGCGSFLALLVIIFATVAITIWYLQRPIKPVVLSPSEKAVVEAKLDRMSGARSENPRATDGERERVATRVERAERQAAPAATGTTPPHRDTTTVKLDPVDPTYVPGGKILRLTEHELNGLLNANTDLGNTVRIEFGRDAINAYVVTPIPDDFPVFGGKMFRARGRFRLSVSEGAPPVAVLEDVTVFGLSLPNAWLGGVKGENLLSDAMGKHNGQPALRGVKSLRIEPGAMVLEVED
jgi:hypothetical protein